MTTVETPRLIGLIAPSFSEMKKSSAGKDTTRIEYIPTFALDMLGGSLVVLSTAESFQLALEHSNGNIALGIVAGLATVGASLFAENKLGRLATRQIAQHLLRRTVYEHQ